MTYRVREQGKIISKHELAREVGEAIPNGLSNSSMYVFYLRKKMEDGQYGHHYIHTMWAGDIGLKRGKRANEVYKIK